MVYKNSAGGADSRDRTNTELTESSCVYSESTRFRGKMVETAKADDNVSHDQNDAPKALLEVEETVPTKPTKRLDVNLYATKKSVAQGMMDIALLTSNASQLRYLLNDPRNSSYYIGISCISISIILQVVVGVLLLFNVRYNINFSHQQPRADTVNNLTTIGVFLITVVNIIATSFSNPSHVP